MWYEKNKKEQKNPFIIKLDLIKNKNLLKSIEFLARISWRVLDKTWEQTQIQ